MEQALDNNELMYHNPNSTSEHQISPSSVSTTRMTEDELMDRTS